MKIEWIDRDFADMTFNPWIVPMDKDMLEVFPMLSMYPEFRVSPKPLNRNNVIRYICYMYDKGSPLLTKVDNIYKQKIEAATLAGFKMNEAGTFNGHVDSMMVGGNYKINHMIIRFLRLMRDEEFMQFRIYKEKLYSSLNKLQEIDDPKKLKEMIALTSSLTAVIDDLKKDFVDPFDSKKLIETLYEQAEFEDLGLSPEAIADRIAAGEDPVDIKPYGEDYKFDKYSERDQCGQEDTTSISGSG